MDSDSTIVLRLTKEEAVVFFEWLSRVQESDQFEHLIEDESERIVVDDLVCDLEKALPEPLAPDYGQVLATYRKALRGKRQTD